MNSAVLLKSFGGFFDRPPTGYLPGATLARMLAQARGILAAAATNPPAGATLATPDGRLTFEVRERVERHFLMHVVALEFTLKVPAAAVPGGRIAIRNTGLWSRTGIACAVPARYREALKPVSQRLADDPALVAALMAFDFRRCELTGSEEGWTVCIEPYGASEVVNRMPSFRRYLRLAKEQADLLVIALKTIERLLGGPEGGVP